MSGTAIGVGCAPALPALDRDGRRPQNFAMRILILLLSLVATPALAADPCDDLWFSRNLIMDRAGYCFGTALGKAIFDNADCTGKSVTLIREEQRQVDAILKQERAFGCKVDTSRRSMDLPDIAVRRRMVDQPVADEFESGCFGWLEVATPLFAARNTSGAIVGRIEPGDNLLYMHWPVDDWNYVTVWTDGMSTFKSGGWMRFRTTEESCRNWAG